MNGPEWASKSIFPEYHPNPWSQPAQIQYILNVFPSIKFLENAENLCLGKSLLFHGKQFKVKRLLSNLKLSYFRGSLHYFLLKIAQSKCWTSNHYPAVWHNIFCIPRHVAKPLLWSYYNFFVMSWQPSTPPAKWTIWTNEMITQASHGHVFDFVSFDKVSVW